MNHSIELLSKLTSIHESERFHAQEPAMQQMPVITRQDLEEVLTSLGRKNVSTLIYVCIHTRNRLLYSLSPPARMALETADGAYPNIAYYYARVDPAKGLSVLVKLYHRQPARQLPICLAIGETAQSDAQNFLVTEARKIKANGGSMLAHLYGLKGAADAIDIKDLFWMLEQQLDREEVIAMAELNIRLTDAQLESLWRSGAAKRNFAVQTILGDPEGYYDALCWMVAQYQAAGDLDTLRQLMHSDSMRSAPSGRMRQYRQSVLRKIRASSGDTQ